ncbi:MAG: peptidase dimerization domain protein, partial [Schleiferiaceae bacterium]|nr:peptidase dimerization domain protein [Schleiferiaceae bacterium]
MDVRPYLNEHFERFTDELKELLRLPSISADPAYADAVRQTAQVVADHLEKIGLNNVEVCATPGYPVVYAD